MTSQISNEGEEEQTVDPKTLLTTSSHSSQDLISKSVIDDNTEIKDPLQDTAENDSKDLSPSEDEKPLNPTRKESSTPHQHRTYISDNIEPVSDVKSSMLSGNSNGTMRAKMPEMRMEPSVVDHALDPHKFDKNKKEAHAPELVKVLLLSLEHSRMTNAQLESLKTFLNEFCAHYRDFATFRDNSALHYEKQALDLIFDILSDAKHPCLTHVLSVLVILSRYCKSELTLDLC
jgi:hypothetical protein